MNNILGQWVKDKEKVNEMRLGRIDTLDSEKQKAIYKQLKYLSIPPYISGNPIGFSAREWFSMAHSR